MTSDERLQAESSFIVSLLSKRLDAIPMNLFAKFTGALSLAGGMAMRTLEAVNDPALKQQAAAYFIGQLDATKRVLEKLSRGEKVDLTAKEV